MTNININTWKCILFHQNILKSSLTNMHKIDYQWTKDLHLWNSLWCAINCISPVVVNVASFDRTFQNIENARITRDWGEVFIFSEIDQKLTDWLLLQYAAEIYTKYHLCRAKCSEIWLLTGRIRVITPIPPSFYIITILYIQLSC